MGTPDYRLISPATIRISALLANPLLGFALLVWNALVLGRLSLALGVAFVGLVGGLLTAHFFAPTGGWFVAYVAAAWLVGRLAQSLEEEFQGHIYEGGRILGVAPLVSFLCALQLLVVSSSLRHYRAHQAEVAEAASQAEMQKSLAPVPRATALNRAEPKQGRRTFGPRIIDYRDVPANAADTLDAALLRLGLFTAGPEWAGLDMTPRGMRVSVLLPQGRSLTPELNQRYQQTADSLKQSMNPGGALQLCLLNGDRSPARVYTAR